MLKALKKVSSKMTTKKDDGQGKWHLGSYNTDELIGKMYMFFEAQVLRLSLTDRAGSAPTY